MRTLGGQVFHCPFCHGSEGRDRKLAVYARGACERLAALIGGWSDDVTVVEPDDVATLGVEVAGYPRPGEWS